eukprot:CAMPEP_0171518860 /NCGR_PEP_ID=MMETSP0959-20130129/5533_1 /TAXON_ID=87120 /ORGANISM="Aurantiochytrium limacinum, Strain ATCCMYA-1381" /LENGTH=131 /DNA_ID=CAMNT_0012058141 /DNA_START=334 /DNA_END=729 /DNA_ORIENTATION=+
MAIRRRFEITGVTPEPAAAKTYIPSLSWPSSEAHTPSECASTTSSADDLHGWRTQKFPSIPKRRSLSLRNSCMSCKRPDTLPPFLCFTVMAMRVSPPALEDPWRGVEEMVQARLNESSPFSIRKFPYCPGS